MTDPDLPEVFPVRWTPTTRRGRMYIATMSAFRRWRNKFFGITTANEAESWGGGIAFHNGAYNDGTPVGKVRLLLPCPICAAYVDEWNTNYHIQWHRGGY